jgi:sigma-E factor negative regulatory protein RseA
MTEQLRSDLSELVDGELESERIAGCLQRIVTSEELRATWTRYHLISDVIRGERVNQDGMAVAEQLAARLQAEPAILAPQAISEPSNGRWIKPVAGSAIAASVALMTVIAVPEFAGKDTGVGPVTTSVSSSYGAASAGTRWNLGKPAAESKLNSYLVDHNEHAPGGGFQGMLPYATLVSYDINR